MNSLLILLILSAAPWQQKVDYDIHVTLDDSSHTLVGHEEVVYVNNSPDTLDYIWFHLYPNAFRKGSVYFHEREKIMGDYSWRFAPESEFGGIDVFDIRTDGSAPRNIRVEDTEMRLDLPQRLPPGDSIRISMDFSVQIPKTWERLGHEGHHYALTQWYPKVVVYDEYGWHPDGYHVMGEFYGEFAHYDVVITMPMKYVLGSTGEIIAPKSYIARLDSIASNEKVDTTLMTPTAVHLTADSVHDFAIVAAPDYTIKRTKCGHITVVSLYYTGAELFSRVPKFVCAVVDSYQRWYGPYPYNKLTVSQAPHQNAMEYPRLVIIPPSTGRKRTIRVGNAFENFEATVAHEIGHQWFYGVLANNEMDEPWLDEGFTTFTQYRFMHAIDTTKRRKDKLPLDALAIHFVMGTPFDRPMLGTKPFEGQIYWINSYVKGRRIPLMVKWIVGDDMFDSIMHTYYRRFAFHHVRSYDFQEVVEEITGQDWDWFFNPWLRKTVYPDFRIRKLGRQGKNELVAVETKGPAMPAELICGDSTYRVNRGGDTLSLPHGCRPVVDPHDIFVETDELNNGKPPHITFVIPGLDYMRRNIVVVPVPGLTMPGISVLDIDYQDFKISFLSALYQIKQRKNFVFGSSIGIKPGVWHTWWRIDGYPPEAVNFGIGLFRLQSRYMMMPNGRSQRIGLRVVRASNAPIELVGPQYSDGIDSGLTPDYLLLGFEGRGELWRRFPYGGIALSGGLSLNYSARDERGAYAKGTVGLTFRLTHPLRASIDVESEFMLKGDAPLFDMPSVGGHRIYRFSWTQLPALAGYYRRVDVGRSFTDVKLFLNILPIMDIYSGIGWLNFSSKPYSEFGLRLSFASMFGTNSLPQLYLPLWVSNPADEERHWAFRAVFLFSG